MNYFDKIYIVSLPDQLKRREAISNELLDLGISSYEFVDAISGDSLESTGELVRQGILAKEFKDPNGGLTKNIIACSISHRKAQQKFLDDGFDVGLILEDDVMFTKSGLKFIMAGGLEDAQSRLNKTDWDIFMWGSSSASIPTWDIGEYPLFEYKRYLPNWAAHAYQINRRGASKLIKSNTPVQYAADVNLECANTNIYCAPLSFIAQRFGDYERSAAEYLHEEFGKRLLQDNVKYGTEYYPSTGKYPASLKNTEAIESNDRSNHYYWKRYYCNVMGDVDIAGVTWKPVTTERGHILHYWTTITFPEL